ncbi:MAG: hypothetical protein WAT39_19210 [Planctomycetota bacterium]
MRFLLASSWWWCALALAGAAQTPPAPDPQPPAPAGANPSGSCRGCLTHGSNACRLHGKDLGPEAAPFVLHCSAATECKACGGALAVDCRQCANQPVEDNLLNRQRLAREWLAGRRTAIDALTAREPFAHLSTTHFELAFACKPAMVGKEKIDQHARMHLYGQRLEELRTVFLQTFELPAEDLPDRCTIAMSEEAKDHAILGPRLTGLGTQNSVGLKLMGPEFVYSMWCDKRSLPDDEAVHRNVVHNVTHLLLSQMRPMLFLGNKQHGWVDEGVAHWFEDKLVGKCTNFCFEEILMQQVASFKGGKWRPAVRKLVDEGKAPSFAALSDRNTDQLGYVEHAFAFAYVDFLLAVHGGAKFRDFVRQLKNDRPTREVLPVVYGYNPLSIDAAFLPWVKANYSPLPR